MYNKEYEGNFYKVFLFLFYDENFSKLPTNAKLMYVLFCDKNDLSKQSAAQGNTQFFDEQNRLYSIYSNEDLAKDLKINVKSVPRLKKLLKEKGLLVEEQQGLGMSNRIYPKQPYTDGFLYQYDVSVWYKLPKALFCYKYYNELDNPTKIFYSILYNTFRYSQNKGKYIYNGKVYCSLTYKKIKEITGFGYEKIKEMKKELQEKHLITYENGGFSKADRFYVHLPQVTKNMEITDSKTWDYLRNTMISIKYKNTKFISEYRKSFEKERYKLRRIKGVTKSKSWKSQNRNHGSNKIEIMEVTKSKPNKTYIIKPYSNKIYSNKTTTKKSDKKPSGSLNNLYYQKYYRDIEQNYNIKLTKLDKTEYNKLFESLKEEIITFAIDYCSKGNNPKQYLKTILANWIESNVTTINQATVQEYKYKKKITSNPNNNSKELTPKWLEERKNNEYIEPVQTPEEIESLEKDRQAFLESLK
ncbi:replication initiator protein A [Staphylococcus equorum]|uniref:replication initiator protein A n=1 Tax=Staphylococcus equorum TaxID=246432 RepID=UPI0024087ADE|nr:replication initiator protein A [Staphylococcus equorum]MDG0844444.1 replication initiator protein A [Staphylococcus equorum]